MANHWIINRHGNVLGVIDCRKCEKYYSAIDSDQSDWVYRLVIAFFRIF